MRLRYVETVHFGKSELTNFLEIIKRRPEFIDAGGKAKLRPDDVVLLVSKQGDQLVFLHGFDDFQERKVLRSQRLRITGKAPKRQRGARRPSAGGGRWNPLALADYAKQVGIHLTGLDSYEAHVRKLLGEK